eukprot:g16668.t1
MDGSPSSAADMLLQRHRSSLQPAAAAATTTAATPEASTLAAGGARASLPKRQQQQQQQQGTGTAVSAAAAAAGPDSELQRMMQAARWGGGQPQEVLPTKASMASDGGVPRMQQQPLSPVILPAREARQPDIVRHEAADVYDVLEFRLRNNDRDLQTLLSRSADRLALSEQQPHRSAAGDLALPSEASPTPAPAPAPAPVSATARIPGAADAPAQPTPQANPLETAAAAKAAAEAAGAAPVAVAPNGPTAETTAAAARAAPASALPPPQEARPGEPGLVSTPPPARSASGGKGVGTATGVTSSSGIASSDGGGGGRSAVTHTGTGTSISGMPAPVARDVAAAAMSGEVVVTPARPTTGGGNGGRSGAASTVGAPPGRPQRVGIGGSSSSVGAAGAATSAAAAAAGGAGGGGVAQGMMVVAGSNSNNFDGLLGTPPRLPPPLANGKIVEAATEAARWLAVDDRTWHQGKKFMDDCTADCPKDRILAKRNLTAEQWRENKKNAIKASLAADPALATLRYVNKSAFPMDGWTPLHAAAARGHLDFVEVLLSRPEVSPWSVDLQGRTPLALAAAGGHLELCLLLKARMEQESRDSIVGINAPVDLSGRTPLAWSVKADKNKRNKEVEGHLYASGDPSVCPATPAALRSGGGGKTGTKAGGAGGTARTGAGRGAAESIGDGLPCGYAEIAGWRIDMEDATCRHNPVPVTDPEAREKPPPDPTSMFGVFDGHGGSYTSEFCARQLVNCLQATPGWKSGDRELNQLCPAVMEAFVDCDELLAKDPRMAVTELENPSDGKRFEARDASGSTAVVAVVTPAHVIVANAGDSRAVLIMVEPDVAASVKMKKAKAKGKSSSSSSSSSSSISSTSPNGGSVDKGGNGGSESSKGTAEALAAALGLRLDGSGAETGVEEAKKEAVVDRLAAAEEGGEGGGCNDSVRLDEQEAGDKGDGEDGCDFEGSEQIRELLEKMMLGEGAEGAGGGGGGGGGGGPGQEEGSGVMVTAMSRDHTAQDEAEKQRVVAAGGRVFEVDYIEEDGTTSMVARTAYDDSVQGQSVVPTRGFGDLYYKQRKGEDGTLLPPAEQVVTVCPEIMVHERGSSHKEELLLLGCDGVWDVFKDQDAGEFLVSQLDVPLAEVTGEHLALACDALVQEALGRGSRDNITAVAVSLGSGPPPPPSAVGGRVLFSDGQ